MPILLNGNAPFGYRGSRHIEIFGARTQRHFDDGHRRGVVAIHTSPRAPTGFRMVVGGVWINTLQLEPLATRPLVGVVCDDNLRKTADQSDIVQDNRYVEMLHHVQPHATELMVDAEGTRYQAPQLPPIPEIEETPTEGATRPRARTASGDAADALAARVDATRRAFVASARSRCFMSNPPTRARWRGGPPSPTDFPGASSSSKRARF